ncbi:MAG: transposase, partial [Nitrosospira sp.]|nr:transposase [Nitrosospira sp.]
MSSTASTSCDNYGKVIDKVRRSEFKKAHADDKQLLAGTRYLLLKNAARLMQCCTLAKATRLAPLRHFAAMLARHAVGICNYAAHPITTGRVE